MNRRLSLPLLSTVLLVLTLLMAPLSARADGESNEVGTCLESDQVWLLVVTDTGEVLANECVGTPATGEEALTDAGLALGYDSNQFICSIAGHPAECPTTFTGAFWNYYQGKAGAEYAFSQVGAGESKPEPGTIEAWCYSTPEEQTCTPPTLKIVENGTEVAAPAGTVAEDLPVTHNRPENQTSPSASPEAQPEENQAPASPWPWAIGGVVIVAAVVALIVWQRSKKSTDGTLGGR